MSRFVITLLALAAIIGIGVYFYMQPKPAFQIGDLEKQLDRVREQAETLSKIVDIEDLPDWMSLQQPIDDGGLFTVSGTPGLDAEGLFVVVISCDDGRYTVNERVDLAIGPLLSLEDQARALSAPSRPPSQSLRQTHLGFDVEPKCVRETPNSTVGLTKYCPNR